MLNNSWQNLIYWRWKVTTGQWIDFYVDARIGNQDIANNRTQIYTKLRSVLSGGTAGGTGYKFTCSYAPTVEGSGVYYFGTKTITETNSEQYVQHNDDGSASVTIETTLYNGYLKLNKTLSATVSLPTIPRKSSVTATSATIGSACSININQKSDTFTHTLRYSFGKLNGTITTGVKYSYGWTVPNDFYSQIPNSPSGTATIYCDTYNGGTLIGTTSTNTTFSANENETKPSVSMSVKDINPITSQLTSGTNESTKIVKGFSNAQITWSSTPKQYASIKSNTINGTSVSESPYTFNNADTNIFTFIATDTRGFSNSTSTTNTSNPLVDYVRLRIDPINFYRIKPTTGEVGLTFEGNYFNDTFGNTENTLELSFKSREKGSTTSWDSIESVSLEGGYYLEGNKVYSGTSSTSRIIQLEGTFEYTKRYEFRFYYKDKIIDEYVDKSISYGQPIFWWNKDGVYDGKTNGKFATLTDIENAKPVAKYAVATINNNVTISSGYKIPVNEMYQSGGFYLLNGYVAIPKGINLLCVSGCVFAEGWSGGSAYLWGQIRKNDVMITGSINTGPGSFLSAPIPPVIMDVKEGDRISLIADSPGGGTLRAGYSNSWLYIQVLA